MKKVFFGFMVWSCLSFSWAEDCPGLFEHCSMISKEIGQDMKELCYDPFDVRFDLSEACRQGYIRHKEESQGYYRVSDKRWIQFTFYSETIELEAKDSAREYALDVSEGLSMSESCVSSIRRAFSKGFSHGFVCLEAYQNKRN